MIKKAKEFISKFSKTSMIIIRHGLQLACGIALIGLVYQINAQSLADGEVAMAIVQTAIIIFGESVIFGVAVNSYANR
ncbi:hypothetical protein FACS189425_00270 [Clostridia bacterium]|nr:hypothetical protein FACS189425_00270 [Clostridia bacterium]